MTDFIATSGNDSFAGRESTSDTVDYRQQQTASGVFVDLSKAGPQQTHGSGSDTFISIENLIGTDFIDILSGTAGNNTLSGMGGSDRLDAGIGGTDRLEGGDGDDVLTVTYTQAGRASLVGGNGYDTFNITLNGANQTASASGGAGDDQFNVNGKGEVTLTLGSGRDKISLGSEQTATVTILDFKAGDEGDVLDLYAYLSAALPGWDGSENPFGNLVKLAYVDGGTKIQVLSGTTWKDAVVLQGVRASNLTAYNLGGYPPDGSDAAGDYLSVAYYTRGTVGDDVMIGGRYTDASSFVSLSGGAGDDVLSGGRMTGGAGRDTFLIQPDGDAIIYDFVAGTDTLVIYGSTAIAWYDDFDGNLILNFDGANRVELKGVTWSDSLANSFIFDTPPAVPPAITHSAPSTGIKTVGNALLTIDGGQEFYHVVTGWGEDRSAVFMQTSTSRLDVRGTIIAEGDNAIGILSEGETPFDPNLRTAHVHIFAGAQLMALGTSGYAYGFHSVTSGLSTQGGSASVTNDGLIKVVAATRAWGISADTFFDATGVTNTGIITVYGGTSATGVDVGYGDFINSGTIFATGADAVGVSLGTNPSFLNSGIITAEAGSFGTGVAVEVTNSTSNAAFVNSGTLNGDYAFMVREVQADILGYQDSVEQIENQASGVINGDIWMASGADVLTNAGRITGSISMGDDDDSLVNTGTIVGDIDLGDGNDTYSGATGLAPDGRIYAGAGVDLVTAGAGTQYIFGEDGDDTLNGGSGDDWIDGGLGNDTLEGGTGYDILSYRSQRVAVTVDLASGTATSTAGTDRISGFQVVIGTRGADVLTGGGADEALEGEDGNDVLNGGVGGGSDTLTGGRGADSLTGGAGRDYFVYNTYDGEDVITDFTVGLDVLVVGGFLNWSTRVQDGLDTVLTFSDGGTVRLRNVTAASLNPADIVFGDSTTVPMELDPGTPRPGSSSVWLSNDFRVDVGEAYILQDQRTGFVADGIATLDNAGTISVSHGGGAWGVYGAGLINRAGAVLYVESWGPTHLDTPVTYGVADPELVDNRGLIKVLANVGWAVGIQSTQSTASQINNSGRIEVRTSGDRAIGLELFRAPVITNSGTIIVEGGGGVAWGILDGVGVEPQHLVNSGTIQVSVLPEPAEFIIIGDRAVGLNLRSSWLIENSGIIAADTAIRSRHRLELDNSGTVRGDIELNDKFYNYHQPYIGSRIVNTGQIIGDIRGDLAFDLVDMATGSLTGTFFGGGGDDYLYAGSQGETFVGGTGLDTADFSRATAGVTVKTTGTNVVAGFGTHVFTGVEALVGSAFGDKLSGDSGHNILTGGKGDDILTGGRGGDRFVYSTGDGNDTITDFTVTGPQFDIIDVHLSGITGWQELVQVGADTKVMFSDIDWILLKNVQATSLTASNFRFVSGSGNVTVEGTSGNDVLTSYYDAPDLSGGATLNGGAGDDVMIGGHVNNRLNGGSGDDYVYVTTGINHIDGGTGIDTIDYSRSGVSVYFNGMGSIFGDQNSVRWYAWDTSDYDYDIVSNVENVIGSLGDDRIEGTNLANRLSGNDGDDKLVGWGGNDVLDGGAGADEMRGGAGNDTYIVDSTDDLVSDRLEGPLSDEGGIDLVLASATFDLHDPALENLTLTGNGHIDGYGAAYDNLLTGNSGNNRLFGRDGNDTLTGGKGNDVLDGGFGSDIYVFALGDGQDEINNQHQGDVLTAMDSIVFDAAIRPSDVTISNDVAGNLIFTIGTAGDRITVNGFSSSQFSQIQQVVFADGTIWGPDRFSFATEGNDTILRDRGNDTINGLGGDDIIYDNAGNDYLDGGTGADTMMGGDGNDTYVVDNAGDVASEARPPFSGYGGVDTVMSSITYQLALDMENLVLTGTAHIKGTGTYYANSLTGNSGNNVLDGGVEGALENNFVDIDTMIGGAGNDTYYVDTYYDQVIEVAGNGTDTVYAYSNFFLGDHIENLIAAGKLGVGGHGNSLDNMLTGNNGDDILLGYGGNDRIDGGRGGDIMDGGLGNDTYYVDNIYDRIDELAGQGTDTVFSSIQFDLGAPLEHLTLTGSANLNGLGNGLDNTLTGNSGNNALNGLDGNDVLNGGTGIDTMVGGLGHDTYYVDNVGDRITEVDGQGTDTVFSSVTVSVAAWSIENVTLAGEAHIDITANGLDNILTGNSGNNSLNGRSGADRMIGGLGNDTYYVDNALDRVTETDGQGADTVFSTVSFSVAAQAVENVTLTGSADIEAIGNSLANVLTGNGGNNSLNGRVGADTLVGGGGHDTYYVDNIGDMVTELTGQGVDTIVTSLSYSLAGLFVEKLTLNGSAGNSATGNQFNNIITGNSGANLIDGGAGADRMTGGLGNDTFVIDDVNDKPTEKAGEGYDTLMTGITFSVAAQAIEAIILTGSGHIDMVANPLDNVITGNSGNNAINGRSGHDTIDGGAGNDTLIGSTGNDILTGGFGADIFLFSKKPGIDTITDFDKAEGDTLNLNEITAGIANTSIVTQSGSDVIIDFGGGHILTIEDAFRADVLTQIVW